MITFAAPATPSFDQQLSATSIDLNAVRQSIDRIAAGQEKLTRSIDQITPGIATGQEEMTHSSDQSAPGIATGQEQMTRSSDQSATGIGQAPPGEGEWHHGREPSRRGIVAADGTFRHQADRSETATVIIGNRQAVVRAERV
jgi:hypothetical protein